VGRWLGRLGGGGMGARVVLVQAFVCVSLSDVTVSV